MTLTRGQNRIKSEQVMQKIEEKRLKKLDAIAARNEGYWFIVKPFLDQYKTLESGFEHEREGFRERHHKVIISAGEYLEQHNCAPDWIVRTLKHDFADVYTHKNLEIICHNYGKDQWFREYEKKESEKVKISDSLTNNVVIKRILHVRSVIATVQQGLDSFVTHIYGDEVDIPTTLHILEEIEGDNTLMESLETNTTKLEQNAELITVSMDLRNDIPHLVKVLIFTANLIESFRGLATIFEKSTKWISQFIRGKKQVGTYRCPGCFIDIAQKVREILSDTTGNIQAEYVKKCQEMDKE